MFEQCLKDYEKQKKVIEKDNEELKKEMKRISEPLTKKVLYGINNNISILHANQQLIEKETKEVKKSVNQFYKEAQNWIQFYNELNESLKSAGDIVDWANQIENDLTQLVNK